MASVPLCALVWTVLVWTVLVWTVLVWSPTSALLQDTVYAVAVSSRVTGGASETLCAHVLSPPEPLALRVTLEAAAGRTTVLLNQTVAEDFYRCSAFQVPMVTDSTVATVRVTLQGKRDVASKKTKVLIAPPAFLHLIQTDKPLYKPGQTVMFRVVSMDTGFIPFNEQYKTVELQDPKRNRIAQWLQRTAVGGILDLSHPMSAEAAQGRYTVTAWTHRGQSVSRSFDIKEYVLPKYAVNIKLPDVINILHREVPIQICGRYTYGKPVLGSVKVVVCRRAPEDICVTSRLQTDKTGCASHTITVAAFRPRAVGYLDMFEVEAEMEEHGTGVVIQASGQTPFSVNVRELTFENVADSVYKPGIPFEGKIKLSGIDRTPLGGEFVYLDVNVNSSSYSLKLLTENNGMAPFSLDTALWEGSVALEANSRPKGERQSVVRRERLPAYPPAHLTVGPFYSKSKSFVKLSTREHQRLCEGESQARAEYIIQGTALRLGQEELNFYYIVMSKGAIMRHGHLPVAVKNGIVNKGVLSIPLLGKAALSPFAQVVVYTLMPSGEVLADSEDFPVDQCFKNRVKLEFSADRELPGGEASFRLESHPGSLCSVRAVDRSVLLLQPDQELTAAYVFNQLPVQKLSGYSEGLEDQEDQEDQGYIPCIPNGEFLLYDIDDKTSTAKDDVYSVFKEIGIKLVSIAEVKKPVYCNRPAEDFLMYEEFIFYKGVEESAPYDLGILPEVNLPKERPKQPKKKTKETVRSYFPETWIWDLIPVGDGGSERVVRTLPDTITSWRAQAFCTSALGFGLSPDAPLLAFQPFFVSLTLPYSVVRGEEFTLRASVFNYLPSCIMVRAELNQSSHFSLRECAGCQYTMCVCAEESGAFQWVVKPSSLGKVTVQVVAEALHTEQLCGNEVAAPPAVGRVDTVVRTLLVEAEGTPVAVTHNALLCPGAEKPAETNVSLLLPDLCVAGSARASFSVLGDLMGRSMKNLDQLLAMPFGCGEQNMILFAPNIYILDYLSSTGQLTPAITERARGFLQSGYQRELTYRHDDGSYSAFGKSDASGNTWLTAFVMKSFGGAKPYIFIDPKQIESSRDWLFSHLRQDGCIVSVGKLFHNGMKGGVSDEVSLTAYTTAALLELDAADPTVPRCLQCLRAAVEGGLENTYTMALLSYAFSLAGDQQTKTALLTALHNKSITDGAMRHWKRAEASEKVLDSLEVETTAYVLLAVLSGPPVPGFDLTYASGAARWLLQQQNPYGGFASTQDTVVALQALARYGAASFSPEVSSEVGLSSLGGARWNFTVDESTRLLYQEQALDRVPGDYHITAQGQGCVQAQITLRYNVPPPGDFSSFHILTSTTAACSAGRPSLTLRVDLRYQGRREETNMVILNLKLLSGYVLQQSSLPTLRRTGGVKRVDLDQGYINIYLDGLKKEVLRSYSVVLEEEEAVRNLRPAVVKVYDYYQTGDEAVADYSSPCAEHD